MKCISPSLINVDGLKRYVPCGHCAWCRKRLRDSWTLRFSIESMQVNAWFVTLTYDDEHLPVRYLDIDTGETFVDIGYHDYDGFVYCNTFPLYEDFTDYISDIRDAIDHQKLKYYVVSEYGSENGRVHYHALIFSDFVTPDMLVSTWKNGMASCLPLQDGGANYVNKYMFKGSKYSFEHDLCDDSVKNCSKGIGEFVIPHLVDKYSDADYARGMRWKTTFYSFPHYFRKKIRQIIDDNSDFVQIEYVRKADGKIHVVSKHCDFLRYLDWQLAHRLPDDSEFDKMLSNLSDTPSVLKRALYEKDKSKQQLINNKKYAL